MSVIEHLQKHFKDVPPKETADWRVFGPMSLDDEHTYVNFYDKYGRVLREFTIAIDGAVDETTKPGPKRPMKRSAASREDQTRHEG